MSERIETMSSFPGCSGGAGSGRSSVQPQYRHRRPTAPASPIPVSSESAGQLEGAWSTAVASSNNGQITVVMTEQQLTSYAALKLTNDANAPIKDPQIYLRDGKMLLY